ncbi:MAG: sugar phosphate isomerase/epimerase, partial [Mucilaginibacter sp.]
TGICIIHETHRGCFSFHAVSLVPYLEKFPEMELAGDFLHFCVVSESMLQGQETILNKIIPHISHIHARIGFEQGPQVNDPTAQEWAEHINIFSGWWNRIVETKFERGWREFRSPRSLGPRHTCRLPKSRLPLSNQWNNNKTMMDALKADIPNHITQL